LPSSREQLPRKSNAMETTLIANLIFTEEIDYDINFS